MDAIHAMHIHWKAAGIKYVNIASLPTCHPNTDTSASPIIPGVPTLLAAPNGPHGALCNGTILQIISMTQNCPVCEIPATKASSPWRGMAWSVDSTTLFAVDTTSTLYAFDTHGNALRTWHVGGHGSMVAWGTCVYIAAGRTLMVVDAAGGEHDTRIQVVL